METLIAFAAGFLIAWLIQALLRKRDSRVASEAHGEMLRRYLEVSRIRMHEMEKMRERIQDVTQEAARWREAFLEAHEIKQECGLTTNDRKGTRDESEGEQSPEATGNREGAECQVASRGGWSCAAGNWPGHRIDDR